jgi:hypothetical protein
MSALDVITKKLNLKVLVTELDVKTVTPVAANKAVSTIVNHIVTSQDLRIKKALGNSLYKALLVEWLANNQDATTLPDGTTTGTPPQVSGDTTNYKELHEYIYMPLCWWAYVLGLSTTAIKVSEAGLTIGYAENSEAAGIEGIIQLVRDGKEIAEQYTENLIEYIEETFVDNLVVNSEAEDVGGVSSKIYVAQKPWHGQSEY